MKIKKIRKNLIIFSSSIVGGLLTPTLCFNYFAESSFSEAENLLQLTISDSEISKMENLNFNYDGSTTNNIYVTDSNKDTIAKQIVIDMLNNETDYYENAISTLPENIKQSFTNNSLTKLKQSVAKESNGEWLWNFFYISGPKEPSITSIYALRGYQIHFLNYLTWNNIGNNQYTISLDLPITWLISFSALSESDIMSNQIVGTFSPLQDNVMMTISFDNIIFNLVQNTIDNFYYIDIDPMNLTNENLKTLFKLNNSITPDSLSFSIAQSGRVYQLNLKKVTYKFSGNQDFTLMYEGNYSVNFVENDYSFNWEVIKSSYSLLLIDEQTLLDELILNQYYKELISNLVLEKDFNNDLAKVTVTFDSSKYQELIFYNYLKSYFENQYFEITFDQNSSVQFNLSKSYQNILLKNFDISYLEVNFVSLPYSVYIDDINSLVVSNEKNCVTFTANLSTLVGNTNYFFTVDSVFSNFEYYEFLQLDKITDFFNDNFYDENNNLKVDQINLVLSNQSYWNYICNFSENIIFKNYQIEVLENESMFVLSFDVYNNQDLFLDSNSISISLKNNQNNEEPIDNSTPVEKSNNFNLNYLWLLSLLLIPLFVFVYKYLKKRNKI